MFGSVGEAEKVSPVLLVPRYGGMRKRAQNETYPKKKKKLAALPRYRPYKIQPDLTNPQFYAVLHIPRGTKSDKVVLQSSSRADIHIHWEPDT